MKTSHIVCIAAALILLGGSTNLVRATTVSYTSSTHARAGSQMTHEDYEDSGSFTLPLPEGANYYDWGCTLEVSARAGIIRDTAGSSIAVATADARVEGGIADTSISAYACVSGTIDTDSDSDSWSDGGTNEFIRWGELDMSCASTASATWSSAGAYTAVYADGYAYIYGSFEVAN